MSDDFQHKNDDSKSRSERTAAVAVAVNTGLTVLKFLLAWLSASMALKVEAFHSFADIGSSLAVLIAVRSEMACKENGTEARGLFANPQRSVSLGIGLFLAVVGLVFLKRTITPEPVTVAYPVPVALVMLGLSLMSFLLARYERLVGESEDCTALVADSFHARVDMFGSFVVAAALLGESLGLVVDRWAALALAIFILSQAVNVFGAVIRDVAGKGEPGLDMIYREWLWREVEKRLPRLVPRLVSWAARRRGLDPESPADRKRAGAVLAGLFIAVLAAAWLLSGVFTVRAGERAVVERLGRPLQTETALGPGLHYRIPWPIDLVRKVDVMSIRRMNVGSAIAPGRDTILWTNDHYVQTFNVLTGENIFVDVGLVVHYRVNDAIAFLYHCREPEEILKDATYSVLTQEFAGRPFMDSITSGRDALEADFLKEVRESIAPYDSGIEVVGVRLRDAHPPTIVAPAFEDVVSATIEYETKINEARGYMNDLIPKSRGAAAVEVTGAKAKSSAAVSTAKGDVSLFDSVLAAYLASPEVNRTRMRIEAAEQVLPGREKIIVPADAADGAVELFLTKDPGRVPGSESK